MKAMRLVWAVLAAVVLSAACGGGGGGGDDGEGNQPSVDKLDPPANIDVDACSSVATVEFGDNSACSDCCSQHSYMASTDYAGRCICGNDRDTSGSLVCSVQSGSDQLCSTCCGDADFSASLWIGGSDPSCTCDSKSDSQVCAAALEGSEPSDSCRFCCLNNGYLGMFYSSLGTPECRCSGG